MSDNSKLQKRIKKNIKELEVHNKELIEALKEEIERESCSLMILMLAQDLYQTTHKRISFEKLLEDG